MTDNTNQPVSNPNNKWIYIFLLIFAIAPVIVETIEKVSFGPEVYVCPIIAVLAALAIYFIGKNR